ncbi:CCR4-NOT transcription complex subunit 4-like isoform X1 [Lytechinus pictus]|uniref:CCR4-NOT transcription complex subunit 4-like isoform X1 n=1 Tax=Lytechinus pictus TaxID=7653 RepID=UPI0030BA1978
MSTFDDPAECPLCMEPLELDDVNFFPCTCGYQICRFCWHRIRTDENGLCPACRKAYPECPADFKPLSEEQMHRIKNEKRQKDIQRKQKITENRKHLASVRVVQKNLVFVVGLSQRLADTEILRKQEYFGKFGKILKVVINQNTSYAGSQSHGPSASAYVTYQRAEDSLRAIQAVNNVHVDGRTLKASLGTTKYCSHFLRNSQCPKLDCMYLHELGDENASFTKEDMQMGKHQEYEQKLLHDLLGGGSSHSPGSSTTTTTTHNHTAVTTASTSATTNSSSATSHAATSSGRERAKPQSNTRKKQPSPPTTQKSNSRGSPSITTNSWPSLSKPNNTEGGDETTTQREESTIHSHTTKDTPSDIVDRTDPLPTSLPQSSTQASNGLTTEAHENLPHPHNSAAPPIDIPQKRAITETGSLSSTPHEASPQVQSVPDLPPPPVTDTRQQPLSGPTGPPPNLPHPGRGAPFGDIAHLFGGNGFIPQANLQRHVPAVPIPGMPPQNDWNNGSNWTAGNELLPVDSHTTDWQAAFGFTSDPKEKHNEDDLGFDPWQESSQGLADLLEKELQLNQPSKITQPPPGFNSHSQPFVPMHRHGRPAGRSKILPWVHSQSSPTSEATPTGQTGPAHPPPANHVPRFPAPRSSMPGHSPHNPNPLTDNVHLKTWQDGLRALLPNINISFGQSQQPPQSFLPEMTRVNSLQQNAAESWVGSPTGSSWAVQDPAIVSIRSTLPNSAETSGMEGEEKPHWLESLQNLTETDSPTHTPTQQQTNRFFPADHIHNRGVSWGNHLPPPGFNTTQIRPIAQNTAEPHTITENL